MHEMEGCIWIPLQKLAIRNSLSFFHIHRKSPLLIWTELEFPGASPMAIFELAVIVRP
jgi:hypothetical protein